MKRASLKVTPTAAPTEPTDLTDRLLDREAERTPPKATAKRTPRRAKPDAPAPAAGAATPAPPAVEPEPSPPVKEAPAAAEPLSGLAAALQQAHAASDALEAATQDGPARYSVAVRYRLEALAQHLRQVADFLQRLNRP